MKVNDSGSNHRAPKLTGVIGGTSTLVRADPGKPLRLGKPLTGTLAPGPGFAAGATKPYFRPPFDESTFERIPNRMIDLGGAAAPRRQPKKPNHED